MAHFFCLLFAIIAEGHVVEGACDFVGVEVVTVTIGTRYSQVTSFKRAILFVLGVVLGFADHGVKVLAEASLWGHFQDHHTVDKKRQS